MYFIKHLIGQKRLRGLNRFIIRYNEGKSFITNSEKLFTSLNGNILK